MLGREVPPDNTVEESYVDDEVHESKGNDSQHETTEEEPNFSSDECYEPDNETDTASELDEDLHYSGERCALFTSYGILLCLVC